MRRRLEGHSSRLKQPMISVESRRGLPDIRLPALSWCRQPVLLLGPGTLGRRRGGDEETRTPDPLLAKEMLFRLSYVPIVRIGATRPCDRVVGVSGLEPETSALSGQCSNQLS